MSYSYGEPIQPFSLLHKVCQYRQNSLRLLEIGNFVSHWAALLILGFAISTATRAFRLIGLFAVTRSKSGLTFYFKILASLPTLRFTVNRKRCRAALVLVNLATTHYIRLIFLAHEDRLQEMLRLCLLLQVDTNPLWKSYWWTYAGQIISNYQ